MKAEGQFGSSEAVSEGRRTLSSVVRRRRDAVVGHVEHVRCLINTSSVQHFCRGFRAFRVAGGTRRAQTRTLNPVHPDLLKCPPVPYLPPLDTSAIDALGARVLRPLCFIFIITLGDVPTTHVPVLSLVGDSIASAFHHLAFSSVCMLHTALH